MDDLRRNWNEMVRKSILVYELLRTEQPQDGYSEKEIIEQISNKHNIMAGKGLRRQVAVALRRGVDFGILAKKRNKFRFDPDNANINSLKRETATRKARVRRNRKNSKGSKKTKPKASTRSKDKNSNKQNRTVPQPKLPKNWVPNRRNINDEPLSKVKKI